MMELADLGLIEACLDQDRVDHGEARVGEGYPSDEGGAEIPAEHELAEAPGEQEWGKEGDPTEQGALLELCL
jgi:hypothetical protein